jgi:hypothetical protein
MLQNELRPISDDTHHFRNCARATRALADKMTDGYSRQVMLGIADIYDDLAMRAGKRLSDLLLAA